MATILTKKSDTSSSVPLAADLTNAAGGAELAVNTADKRLYSKTSGGSVVELGTNPSALSLPNGTANGVPYLNGSKVLTTGSALTFDGTNLSSTGGATFQGGPTGYGGGEVRLGTTASGQQSAISTLSVDSPVLIFDHRGISNTGVFVWRNGTGGASELMRLTSTGLGIGTSSPQSGATLTTDRAGFNQFFMRVGGTNRLSFYADTAVAAIDSQNTRMAFYTNGAERMVLDTSGNLGLGVTPSAWDGTGAGGPVLQIKRGLLFGADTETRLIHNAVYSTGDFRYIATGIAATNYQQSSGQHRWYTAPSGTAGNAISFTQAMTLDASGNLLVGTTSVPVGNRVNGHYFYANGGYNSRTVASARDWGISVTSGAIVNFYSDNGSAAVYAGSINVNGNVTSYTSVSDYRLKKDVVPMSNALVNVMALRPVTYTFKDGGQVSQGFIAHELQAVLPDCVTGEKDAVDAEGNPVYQGIDTSFLVATLTAAIQEQQAIITALTARVAALESK